MPFISSYTTSYKARNSRNVDAWTPDGGVFRATSGLAFWIDASDTSSYTQRWFGGAHYGVDSITDKAGNNAITINNSGNTNDEPPSAYANQNGVPSDMPVFEFSGESFTTGEFAQVDSDGNHWSIALVRAGNDGPGNPYGSSKATFWCTENSTAASGSRRDYSLEMGNGTYWYGQLSMDSLDTPDRVNNDDVIQYDGNYGDPNVNVDQNLIRFDGFGSNENYLDRRTWYIITIVFNKTGNQILVRVNGENAFTPVDYDNSLNTNLSVRIGINRSHDNYDTTFFCQVAELMTFAGKPGTGGTDLSEVERLEGYLAHKWANQSLLPTTHPYRNYSQASLGDWNPSQGFPTASGNMDTAFWVDISDGDNHNFNANNHIDSVTDKSGNSTLSLDDDTEIWRGSISGKYYFAFQGNTGISTTSTSVQASNGNHWAIGLMRYDSINSPDDAFWHLNSTDGTNRDYAIESRNSYTSAGWAGETVLGNSDITPVSGNHGGSTIYWNESTSSSQANSAVGQGTWTIIAMYFNKTGNQIGVRINGTDIITPVGYDNSLSTNQEVHLWKNRSEGQGDFLNGGDLAEFFTFADIPGTGGTDISFVEIAEGYLAHKWVAPSIQGVTLADKLPSDHPFKNSAP